MYVRYRKACCDSKKANSGTPPQAGAAKHPQFVCPVRPAVPVPCGNGGNGRDGTGPADRAAGMYGAILLHESAGGYVLLAVATFMLAVVITVVCMRLHEREKQKQKQEQEHKEDAT